MTAEIVHHDDVAGVQRGKQQLLDVAQEALAVDWAVDELRRFDPVVAQRSQEGRSAPAAVRNFGRETAAARRPSAQRRHVGPGPGLVDEHQPKRINAVLISDPLRPPARDVGTIAFASHHAFF